MYNQQTGIAQITEPLNLLSNKNDKPRRDEQEEYSFEYLWTMFKLIRVSTVMDTIMNGIL